MSTLPLETAPYAPAEQSVVLVLSELIGSGHDREVWRHPMNRVLGVKVAKPEQEREQNHIELHYGQRLERLGVPGPHMPRVHGWVQTDHGRGLVVDLVLEPDGTPCPTLPQALRSGRVSEMEAIGLVYEAYEWLARNGVILADYGINNFLVQTSPATGRPCLVFVDGLGARNLDFKYWARCTFAPFGYWTARAKARHFRDKSMRMLRDRSSRMWVPKRRPEEPESASLEWPKKAC